MCIGIIRNNSLVDGRARAESNPGHWARHALLHMAAECVNHSATKAGLVVGYKYIKKYRCARNNCEKSSVIIREGELATGTQQRIFSQSVEWLFCNLFHCLRISDDVVKLVRRAARHLEPVEPECQPAFRSVARAATRLWEWPWRLDDRRRPLWNVHGHRHAHQQNRILFHRTMLPRGESTGSYLRRPIPSWKSDKISGFPSGNSVAIEFSSWKTDTTSPCWKIDKILSLASGNAKIKSRLTFPCWKATRSLASSFANYVESVDFFKWRIIPPLVHLWPWCGKATRSSAVHLETLSRLNFPSGKLTPCSVGKSTRSWVLRLREISGSNRDWTGLPDGKTTGSYRRWSRRTRRSGRFRCRPICDLDIEFQSVDEPGPVARRKRHEEWEGRRDVTTRWSWSGSRWRRWVKQHEDRPGGNIRRRSTSRTSVLYTPNIHWRTLNFSL